MMPQKKYGSRSWKAVSKAVDLGTASPTAIRNAVEIQAAKYKIDPAEVLAALVAWNTAKQERHAVIAARLAELAAESPRR